MIFLSVVSPGGGASGGLAGPVKKIPRTENCQVQCSGKLQKGCCTNCGGDGGVSPWIGTKQLGVAGKETRGNSVATDANGNVYLAGYTQGGLDGNTLTGTTDFFFTKYNSSGDKQYTRQLGVAEQDTAGESVATDANGNVYVAGTTWGGLDGNALTGTLDFFVTKYNSSGVKQ
jgi:hypothetical protein